MVAVQARSGIGVNLLYAVNMPQEKIQLLCLSTPTSFQHQSIIATVQFIMPSPLFGKNINRLFDFWTDFNSFGFRKQFLSRLV
jgi:hypothetical protein